ncbi:maleylpyruvate isomerase N-terminal domain-containing protein [Actinoplanes sp. NPDC023714]|uniref:maleylpyruvate isomerase N-terminal domain-containing protein n=1 Tax=Actinoplanes sp. NPDC023714 TaxID=3154322 RepID=UPI0033C74BB5
MDADHVDRAAGELLAVLTPLAGRDWEIPAYGLDWTCRQTAAHVAHDLTAYATQLTGRPDDDYLPLDLVVRPSSPAATLRVTAACAGLLSAALRTAGPGTRAWHWGPTDPSGFAALGVNEMMVHTYDITRGLGVDWRPPGDLSAAVLARLFPDAPDGDPAEVLLWCTGRIALPNLPKRPSWTLQAAVT